ncbi:MAG: precorrin-6y C5,15-methyltransferase (decarboxylating) subunit CbiE [Phycisphaerae bacterium]|nr:precorrin-6y C5,15-methyltransferase (decarboxylating) subunit CbiE [Phycisphaerae bacterium]
MAVTDAKILIVGCGPGSPAFVSPAAREAVAAADVLVGAARLLALFADDGRPRVVADGRVEAVLDEAATFVQAGRTVALLVSGDPGLFSLARSAIKRFSRAACRIVPAVSSVQVAFARLGLEWVDAKIISAHGRTPATTIGELAANDKIAILAGTAGAIAWCAQAAAAMAATHAAFLLENLTLADERVRELTPGELANTTAAALSIVLLVRKELMA